MRHLLIATFALLLSGCGIFGAQPGLTEVEITSPNGLHIRYDSGKEFALLKGSFTTADGTSGTFEVQGVEAFPGQAILAEMQARQIDALSGMVDLMKSLAAAYASGGLIPPKPPAPPVGP